MVVVAKVEPDDQSKSTQGLGVKMLTQPCQEVGFGDRNGNRGGGRCDIPIEVMYKVVRNA